MRRTGGAEGRRLDQCATKIEQAANAGRVVSLGVDFEALALQEGIANRVGPTVGDNA